MTELWDHSWLGSKNHVGYWDRSRIAFLIGKHPSCCTIAPVPLMIDFLINSIIDGIMIMRNYHASKFIIDVSLLVVLHQEQFWGTDSISFWFWQGFKLSNPLAWFNYEIAQSLSSLFRSSRESCVQLLPKVNLKRRPPFLVLDIFFGGGGYTSSAQK